jgi:hypothetical protein
VTSVPPGSDQGDSGGCVCVTLFRFRRSFPSLRFRIAHATIARRARTEPGFSGAAMIRAGRGEVLSISLWHSVAALRSLGEVGEHVSAVRNSSRIGVVSAQSGVYLLCDDWRSLIADRIDGAFVSDPPLGGRHDGR